MAILLPRRNGPAKNKEQRQDKLNPRHPIASQVTDLYSFKSLQNAVTHTGLSLVGGCLFDDGVLSGDGVNGYAVATLSRYMPTGSSRRWYSGVVTLREFDTGTLSPIWAHGNGGSVSELFMLLAEDSALSVAFNGHRLITPKSALSVGQKVHAFIQNKGTTSGSVDIYIDGIKQTLTTEAGASVTLSTTSQFQFFDDNIGAAEYGKHDIELFVCGEGNLSDADIYDLAQTPYQILKPRRKFWVVPGVAAGGVALTGTSGTGQVGSVTRRVDSTKVATGVAGTGQVGSVATSISVTRSLAGVDGTGAVGSTGVSVSATRALSGAEATGAVGTVTTGADVTTSLTSVSATGQVGTVGVAKSGSAALTGLQATGQAGSVAASLTVTRDLTGLASTGEIGSVGLIVSATRSLTGVESTGAVGTVDTGNNAAVALVGIGGVGQVGSVAFTQYGSATLSGAEGTGAVGSVSVAGASLTLTDGTFFQGVLNSDIYLQNTLTSDIYLQGGLE